MVLQNIPLHKMTISLDRNCFVKMDETNIISMMSEYSSIQNDAKCNNNERVIRKRKRSPMTSVENFVSDVNLESPHKEKNNYMTHKIKHNSKKFCIHDTCPLEDELHGFCQKHHDIQCQHVLCTKINKSYSSQLFASLKEQLNSSTNQKWSDTLTKNTTTTSIQIPTHQIIHLQNEQKFRSIAIQTQTQNDQYQQQSTLLFQQHLYFQFFRQFFSTLAYSQE
ncbi:unnamed protein product [Didymodactylos carnosus]|uniref:Uncharacterized protein n=1 Tax=Didymodactylos carnosus TaxID=1234261 RepID=A0A8S2F3K7_9BILA|nr:unnamed protein product [Didymodactylos carnosus]CAF4190670.1 unnamed protein product [Didymodactylos carnosus]